MLPSFNFALFSLLCTQRARQLQYCAVFCDSLSLRPQCKQDGNAIYFRVQVHVASLNGHSSGSMSMGPQLHALE